MKVKDLQKKLEALIEQGHGEYDLMIKVGEQERDLITIISDIKEYSRDLGYVEFDTKNHINW